MGMGKQWGIELAEELLPTALPALLLTDSLLLLKDYQLIWDATIPSKRSFIRQNMSGIGKGAIGRIVRDLAL